MPPEVRLSLLQLSWAACLVCVLLAPTTAPSTRSPHCRARHIFVDWVRSQETATNLDEDAAAMIMGNSVKTWNAVYHLAFVEQQAQKAVDGMAQVRAELDAIIGRYCTFFSGGGGGFYLGLVGAGSSQPLTHSFDVQLVAHAPTDSQSVEEEQAAPEESDSDGYTTC